MRVEIDQVVAQLQEDSPDVPARADADPLSRLKQNRALFDALVDEVCREVERRLEDRWRD